MKNLLSKRILYLYTGDHPVHRKFAESVGSKIIKMAWKIPVGYDIYFSEGEFFKLSILKILGRLGKNVKIINLFSDPRLFYLDRRIRYDVEQQKIRKTSVAKRFIFKKLMKILDGTVCVGKFEERLLRKYYHGPIKKVNVFIEKSFHKRLLRIKPKLTNKKILFIGNGPDVYYKGLDLFVEVAKDNPNIEFTVTGGSFEKFVSSNPIPKNVKFTGRLGMNSNKMSQVIKDHSLYVHLGRGEAFGITILEAMAAGLPCIVSDLTGAKEAVEKVDSDFVVPLNKTIITNKIKEYFSKSLAERKNLSKKFKDTSKFYDEQKQLLVFKKQFGSLMGEIYGGK